MDIRTILLQFVWVHCFCNIWIAAGQQTMSILIHSLIHKCPHQISQCILAFCASYENQTATIHQTHEANSGKWYKSTIQYRAIGLASAPSQVPVFSMSFRNGKLPSSKDRANEMTRNDQVCRFTTDSKDASLGKFNPLHSPLSLWPLLTYSNI